VVATASHVTIPVGTSLELAERALIMATLRSLDGSKSKAAQVLGISLKTLYNRLHAYGGVARATLDTLPEVVGDVRLAA
jgi:DNA-binding NtrC family response regulator